MARQQPIELFMPPNVLKAKVGGSGSGLDMSAIKRAEQAIENLKEDFADWIATDVMRLSEARAAYETSVNSKTQADLYRAAHDLKGQGQTFDFPMVSRIAASLCTLADAFGLERPLPIALVDAHVDAIKVIVRENIRTADDRMASVLAQELERQVAAVLDKNGLKPIV